MKNVLVLLMLVTGMHVWAGDFFDLGIQVEANQREEWGGNIELIGPYEGAGLVGAGIGLSAGSPEEYITTMSMDTTLIISLPFGFYAAPGLGLRLVTSDKPETVSMTKEKQEDGTYKYVVPSGGTVDSVVDFELAAAFGWKYQITRRWGITIGGVWKSGTLWENEHSSTNDEIPEEYFGVGGMFGVRVGVRYSFQ